MSIEHPSPDPHISSPPLNFRRALRTVLLSAGLFALVGLLLGLRVTAQATLPHILQQPDNINYQEVIDGLPVPRLLAWNQERIEFLMTLRDLSGVGLALAGLLVFGPLWLFAVRRVNATFQFFGAAPPAPQPTASADEPRADEASETSTGQREAPETDAASGEVEAVDSTPFSPDFIEAPDTAAFSAPSHAPPAFAEPAPIAADSADSVEAGRTNALEAKETDSEADSVEIDTVETVKVETVKVETVEAKTVESAPEPIAPVAAPRRGAAPPAASSTLNAPLEFYGLIKAFTLLLALGLPLAAIGFLIDLPDGGPYRAADGMILTETGPLIGPIWALRLVLMGSAFWLGFHRDGIAGDFTRPEWNASRRRWPSLVARGALFGLIAFAFCRYGLPQRLPDVLVRLQTLGTFNSAAWREIAIHALVSFSAIWLAMGALFALFIRTDIAPRHRGALLLVPLAAFLFAVFYQRALTPQSLAARYDIRPAVLRAIPENGEYRPGLPNSGVPDMPAAVHELANQLHLSVGPSVTQPGRTLVLFDQRLALLTYQNGYTFDGLAADQASVGLVSDFLDRREHRSALSWVALKHLYNMPLMRFDTTGGMAVALRDLTHTPHNTQFTRALQQMLAVCAATPENLALLDQWADETKFDHPDRESCRLLGDLYRRFGNVKQALRWYGKAEMPASFLKRVQTEPPMFHTGHIEGALRLNGRPLAGVQVAVVPTRMNGLPRGMEPMVYHAREEILNADPRFTQELFPLYHPSPWPLRWISASATTDSQGRYSLDNLTEAEYTVLCSLPPNIHTRLPEDDRLRILRPPRPFALRYAVPRHDLGATDIEWSKP